MGAISLGWRSDGSRIRRKVTGRTKTEVRDKLKAAHGELDRGLHTSATYTIRQAVDDWLEGGLPGRSERTPSIVQPVPPSVAVWHSVRQDGDTKTAGSRRTLALP